MPAATPSWPRSPRTGRTSPRWRRSTTPASPRRPGSSATSRSTTCAWPCSRPTRCVAGSDDRRPPASSATPCSCCSPGVPRRSPSGSSGSPTASRPRRRSSSRPRPGRSARRSRSWQRTEARYAADLPSLFAEVRAAAEGVLDGPALARLDRSIADASAALEAYGGWVRQTHGRRHRGLAAGQRPLRRARPAAVVRGPGRGRDPPDRARAAAVEPRGSARGGARARPGRGPAERHRAPQERRPGDVRAGARRLSRGRCTGRAPISSSTAS